MARLSLGGGDFFGGIAWSLDCLPVWAALAITIDLAVFIWKVDWKNGLLGDHGYQLPLALAAIAFALIFFDAGQSLWIMFAARRERKFKSA